MFFAMVVAATLSQAAAQETKVIHTRRAAKTMAARTQAELDAEARAEDVKRRCGDASAGGKGTPHAKALNTKEEALRLKEAELAAREEAIRKKQDEGKEVNEKTEKERAEAKKLVEKQAKQLQQTMQGLNGALAGEE
jgi:hypothetical protein